MVREASTNQKADGEETKLLKLQSTCGYPYLHGILFPGQSFESDARSHVFKMSTTCPDSGVELVNKMRQDSVGYLKHSWVCFDHVRRVVG